VSTGLLAVMIVMPTTDPAAVVTRYIHAVRDGKIAAVREFTDTQHAAHVLFGQP
jgi:ketosteroid isomerase-like protein